MTGFDLFMVILGLALVAVSFFFGEKVSAKDEKNLSVGVGAIDEDRLLTIQNTLEDNLKNLSESTIAKTENSLSKITNEKIMAITDYSDQILEKIDQNHTEVVFLYNMLNEKDEAMKESYSKPAMNTSMEQESQASHEQEETQNRSSNKKKNSTNNHKSNNKQSSKKKETSRDIHGINDEEAALLTNSISYQVNEDAVEEKDNTNNNDSDKHNNNAEIIKLYEEGKSITEIAKMLDLGKGEVTFVVNLYKKK